MVHGVLFILLLTGIAYLIALVVYRLWFHPLARFPGPRWAAITEYWELYQDYFCGESGHLYFVLDELHKQLGPVVRIRPNEVHVLDPDWTEVLYTGPSDPRDRDPIIGRAFGTSQASVGTGPFELHRARRAAIAPFFSAHSINKMEPRIIERGHKLFEQLEDSIGEILDIRPFLYAWTTDFLTITIFDLDTHLFWDPERAKTWFYTVWNFSAIFPIMKSFPWLVTTALALPVLTWKIFFPPLVEWVSLYKHVQRLAIDATNNSRDKVVDQKNTVVKGESKFIFESIMDSKLSQEEKLPKRMANEVFNLLIAGSLTTSKTACCAIFHVLDNPDVHAKLKAELMTSIPNRDKMPSVRVLHDLPMLTSIIKETFRVGAIINTRAPVISRYKALQYGDMTIPAGSVISMSFSKIGYDERVFKDPYKFRPERWLDGSHDSHAYDRYVLPFGRGVHVCPGQQLAYSELYAILAGIFRRLDLELFETIRERDVDMKGGGPHGETSRSTTGIRIRVKGLVP